MTNDKPRPRVLICDPIAEVGVDMLREHAEVDIAPKLSPAELIARIPDYQAMVVRSGTQVTAEVIEHALKLKIIGRAGAGLDNIDVVAATEAGIQVVNSPDANTMAVAEHTLGLIIAMARRLPRADSSIKAGRWEKKKLMGIGLSGKTLGIVGFGRIGREVAIRAKAFGMKVVVNQRRPTPELNLEAGVEAVDLADLLRQADFITLHVPLKPETQAMIGPEELALMKPTAFIINTARGGVIDETALLTALNDEKIAGAALDVFEEEPDPNPQLVTHPAVIATPHIAASTEDAQEAAAITIAERIIDLLAEVEPTSVLPLRIVPMERVVPHEAHDPRRVQRMASRFQEDGYLSNPPVVAEVEDRYIVLDGATRVETLRSLDYPHAVVQVITSEQIESLDLHTWFHVIQDLEPDKLVTLLDSLPTISMVESDADRVLDEMFEYGGLCYIETLDGRVFLVQPQPGANRLAALNKLTETYISASVVDRTLERNIISLQHAYPEMTALVVFPEHTVSQVLQVVHSGRQFPAGITRFIIPGRILRLNLPLDVLQDERSLREKNRWLQQQLTQKLHQGKIRYYQEPVYLLDE